MEKILRITYRAKHVDDYWEKRWSSINLDEIPTNIDVYPMKYADLLIGEDKGAKILEAGCGAGRVLRYYNSKGFDISGFDYIGSVVEKLNESYPSMDVIKADIKNLPYKDNQFDYLLAFGLFHNLEKDLDKAFNESFRVLKSGGKICASFRADNIQNRLNDFIQEPSLGIKSEGEFHKLNLTKKEYTQYLENAGFEVKEIYPVVNMPLLYKFMPFRKFTHIKFNENLGRKEGYQLNFCGRNLHKALIKNFPYQFCNIFVAIGEKS